METSRNMELRIKGWNRVKDIDAALSKIVYTPISSVQVKTEYILLNRERQALEIILKALNV
jgi:hypothetical protein